MRCMGLAFSHEPYRLRQSTCSETSMYWQGYVLTPRARWKDPASRRTHDERSRCAVRKRDDRDGLPDGRARDRLLGIVFPANGEAARRCGGGQAVARDEGSLEGSAQAWREETPGPRDGDARAEA